MSALIELLGNLEARLNLMSEKGTFEIGADSEINRNIGRWLQDSERRQGKG